METTKALPTSKDRLLNTCFLLFCLCLIDAIFTDFGIRYGHISESNPIMRYIYEANIVIFYFVKISLPALLFTLMHFCKPSKYLRYFIVAAVAVYVFVISLHIYWIVIITAFI